MFWQRGRQKGRKLPWGKRDQVLRSRPGPSHEKSTRQGCCINSNRGGTRWAKPCLLAETLGAAAVDSLECSSEPPLGLLPWPPIRPVSTRQNVTHHLRTASTDPYSLVVLCVECHGPMAWSFIPSSAGTPPFPTSPLALFLHCSPLPLHAVSTTAANPTHTHMKQDVLAMLEGEGLHAAGRSTPFVLAAPLSALLSHSDFLREVSFFWPTSHCILVRTHALTMHLSYPHKYTSQTHGRRRVVGSQAPEQVSVGASVFFRFSPSSTSPPLPDLGQRARSVRGSVCL